MEQGGLKGVLNGIQGIGAGAGHGISGKGEPDKNNTEGRERIGGTSWSWTGQTHRRIAAGAKGTAD